MSVCSPCRVNLVFSFCVKLHLYEFFTTKYFQGMFFLRVTIRQKPNQYNICTKLVFFMNNAQRVCVFEDTKEWVIPQLLSDEDDPPLEDGCSEHQQHLLVRQAAEQCGEGDVLQPGIQRPRQSDDLMKSHHRQSRQQKYVCLILNSFALKGK